MSVPSIEETKQRNEARPAGQPLTMADAIDIWIARWMRVRRRELCRRYGCDPRRLYEIWAEERWPGSRDAALAIMADRHPRLAERIDSGRHRRIPRAPPGAQLELFD